MAFVKENTKQLFKRILLKLQPPPDITLSQWADKYRKLSSAASAESGQWKTTEYQREIMDSITNIDVEKVVVMSCSQIGKTDAFLLNTIGYYMHYDPTSIMVLQPTLTMGEEFSKNRLSLMLMDTPVLRNKVVDGKRTGNTILQKLFPGGSVTIIGSNSPQSLASRPVRILLADEIDRYPASAGDEGDPLILAGKRQATFWNRKEICVSTPTIKNISRIATEYEHSTQGVWNVPCPECGKLQPLVWQNVIYKKDDITNIRYVCEHCGVISDEAAWKEKFKYGKYIHKYPNRKTKGFRLNALASTLPGAEWSKVVENYIIAKDEADKGNYELLKSWTNTEMGETWEMEGEALESDKLLERCEDYGCEVPKDVICLTAGVDTQDDRFEVEVVGWGVEKESYGIKYARIYGDMKSPEIWEQLDEFLKQTFIKEDGTKLKVICTCIDSGGHYTNEVYRFTKARMSKRIFAIKGRGGAGVAYISAPSRNNRYKTPLFIIGVDAGKSILYDRLKVSKKGPNYCHFPADPSAGYDERYFKGLTAEKQVMVYKKGNACYSWELKDPSFKRNEPFDIRNYATAALEIANPVLKIQEPEQQIKKNTKRRRINSHGVKI
ncbi:MAG: phage terminase large subunit family protein [Clostridia bacterium]|jgi:phage terminase large subunit GpA-like protein|nr:phage terminase large subunit family protein [Clostridia bacterium]